MASKITLFDHNCNRLVEFSNIPTTPRAWSLNGYSVCNFAIGVDATKKQSEQLARESYLQFGNLIHIEHIPTDADHGKLPNWTGIILPEQQWDLGVVRNTAYSAESILAFRAMPYVSVKNTPRNIMQQIINIVHERAKNIIFQPGILDDLPQTVADDLRTNAYDHIQKMIKNTGMDWDVTGEINAKGNLDLYINLYNHKGYDTQIDLTNLNTELQSPLLSIQGTPSNQVFGYSQSSTANGRYMAEAIHKEALADYGPLQLNQVFVGMHDLTSVYNAAKTRAEERGRPVWRIKRVALDYKKTFDSLAVGNIVNVKDTNVGFSPDGGYGFEKKFRILSIDYNDLSNKAPMNLEVI